MTTVWFAAAFALLPPLAIALVSCGRGSADSRLVSLQFASSLAALLLIVMSFAFDQPASIDLALAFVLVSLTGMLLFALFWERWL